MIEATLIAAGVFAAGVAAFLVCCVAGLVVYCVSVSTSAEAASNCFEEFDRNLQ